MSAQERKTAKRRLINGSKKVVSYRAYCEHLDLFRPSLGSREFSGSFDDGTTRSFSTLEFDDDTVSKLDVGKFLDDLSDEERYHDAERTRDEETDPTDPTLTERARKRAENIVSGKRKRVPLSAGEVKAYEDGMLEKAWDPSEADLYETMAAFRELKKRNPRVSAVVRASEKESRASASLDKMDEVMYF
jgi:hypothetical protein